MKWQSCQECRQFNAARQLCGVTIRAGRQRYRIPVAPDDACTWQTAKSAIAEGRTAAQTAREWILLTRDVVDVT